MQLSKWQEIRWRDFVEVNPKMSLIKGNKYPFIEMQDILPANRYISSDTMKIYNGGGAKFIKGDTLFARITPCLENGKIAQVKEIIDEYGFGSTEFIVFRGREGISDKDFVYYISRSDIIRQPAIKSMSGASGRQRADQKVVENTIVNVPQIGIQHKIASILSAYDDLIENNNRRIKILEEMAQTIYNEWFVKFRFPGHSKVKMVDSELGKIPEGWAVEKTGDVFETVLGGTPSRVKTEYWENGNIPWINSGKVNELRIIDESEFITELGLKKSATKLMPKRTTVLAITGATLGQVSLLEIEACANQSVVGIYDEKAIYNEYIYFKFCEIIQAVISKAGGGAQQHINKEIVNETIVVFPSQQLIEQFNTLISPIFDLIGNLLRKNKFLQETRDVLLPKLISGEIDVEHLDIKTEDKE
ncbi:MAG: restriction endonuclease subunit S [Candidatus Omnitrophota bacterium]|nr:restriction endonuclease subunit S [Candidatus Omnitrophota bacterium]